jgi:hypothetical protein
MTLKMEIPDSSFWTDNLEEYVRLITYPSEREAIKEGLENAFRARQIEQSLLTRH